MGHRSTVGTLKLAVLGGGAAWLASGGCTTSSPVEPPKEAPRVVVVADGGEPITAAELDELTRAFADRYVGLLYSACDAVRQDNPDPVQGREAAALLVDCSSNVYDIASNADAFTRLLDLVVVTRLISMVWVEDGRAQAVFGERAAPLLSAMAHTREESQTLAERVLTTEQLVALESLLVGWRAENPEMVRASFVRFSNFAVGRGRSAASEVLAARGFFAEVGNARQAVDEARLLGERFFYQMKREPTLLRWQVAAAKEDALATPAVAGALADVHRLTELAEQLPAHIAAEREAILAAVDSRLAGADASVSNIKDAVSEVKTLVVSLDPLTKSLDQLLKTADALLARYDAYDRWVTTNGTPPFDIRQYTELMKESVATTRGLNDVVKSSTELLASPVWHARMDDVNRSADGRIETLAGQSRAVMDDFFRRLYLAMGVLFALLVGYRVISVLLARAMLPRAAPPAPRLHLPPVSPPAV